MISIIEANEDHAVVLAALAETTFLESHGHSAEPEDIRAFIAANYNAGTLLKELEDKKNIFHLIYQEGKAAGFSKIIPNLPYENATLTNITKLERIYLLKQFYGTRLAQQLLDHILDLIREKKQAGIWLYVWKENSRAIHFYQKNGFTINGSHDFKISANHSNPNHRMLLDLT